MTIFFQPLLEPSHRGRHSSNDASASENLSYSYFAPIQMTQSVGPMSLPIQPCTAVNSAVNTSTRPNLPLNKPLSEVMDCQGMAMSR